MFPRILVATTKTIQHEMFPSSIMYSLSIYTMSTDLAMLILFLIGLFGMLISIVGNFQRSKGKVRLCTKFIKLVGRGISHGTTVITLVLMMTSLFKGATPS